MKAGFRPSILPIPDQVEHDDFGCCGLLRGMHEKALMLELRLHNGRAGACSYLLLDYADYEPLEGITLFFGRRRVRIIGQNLHEPIRPGINLFEALTRHRVLWLRENDPESLGRGQSVIERIEIED